VGRAFLSWHYSVQSKAGSSFERKVRAGVLDREQTSRISEKVRIFPDIQYSVAVSSTDPDHLGIVMMIEQAVNSGGWTEVNWAGRGRTRNGRPNIGIGVSVVNILIEWPYKIRTRFLGQRGRSLGR
jgi:hypothetical protein